MEFGKNFQKFFTFLKNFLRKMRRIDQNILELDNELSN